MTQSEIHWLPPPVITRHSVAASCAVGLGNAVSHGSNRPRDMEFALLQEENQRLRELVASLLTPKGWVKRGRS